jgi:hypothetical protein
VFGLREHLRQIGSVERDTAVALHSGHGAVHGLPHGAAGAAQAVRGIRGIPRKLNDELENVRVARRNSLEPLPKPDGIMGPVHPSYAEKCSLPNTVGLLADAVGQTLGTSCSLCDGGCRVDARISETRGVG